MKKRRQPLGKKCYLVCVGSIKGNAIVEVTAHTADAAKAAADRLYRKDGWYALSARAKK